METLSDLEEVRRVTGGRHSGIRGFWMRTNPQGMERFLDYLDVLEMSELGILSFQMDHLEQDFTKKAILDYFQDDGTTGQ